MRQRLVLPAPQLSRTSWEAHWVPRTPPLRGWARRNGRRWRLSSSLRRRRQPAIIRLANFTWPSRWAALVAASDKPGTTTADRLSPVAVEWNSCRQIERM